MEVPLKHPNVDYVHFLLTKELQAKSQMPPLLPQGRNPTGQKQFPAKIFTMPSEPGTTTASRG